MYDARRAFKMSRREFWRCGVGEWNALVTANNQAVEESKRASKGKSG